MAPPKVSEDKPPGDAARRLVWDRNTSTHRPPDEMPRPDHFIKGPLPCPWLRRAGELPGKALHVALGLWWVRGMVGRSTFQFKRQAACAFGASKDAIYDALTRLESAGLVSVQRSRGRSPVVTIRDD